MSLTAFDHEMMARALRLAERGLYTTDPNPRVGCVIVKDGVIVGEGWHERAGEPHAEINALRQAGDMARGADCYVTLEPCSHHGRTPPCATALVEAGVTRVVAAIKDPNPLVAGRGLAILESAGIQTESGCLQEAAAELNAGFLRRMQNGNALVRLKMAMSLDGRTALANGASQWITGSEARGDVQRLRARSSAVVTGIGTVLADNPSLNVRSQEVSDLSGGRVRQPLRVVLDSSGSIDPDSRLLALEGKTLIVTRPGAEGALRERLARSESRIRIEAVEDDETCRPDLSKVVQMLSAEGCNEILVEAGPTLAGAFLKAGLVDELWLYTAPKVLGADARPAFGLGGFEQLADVPQFKLSDCRQLGNDIRMIYLPE